MGRRSLVERTNDSSTVSKLSMLRAGYVAGGIRELEYFVKWERRTALINRGYFIRVASIKGLFDSFIRSHVGEPIQLVNLGAGFDVLFLHLLSKTLSGDHAAFDYKDHVFVEIDLESVIRHKAAAIRSNYNLRPLRDFKNGTSGDLERISSNYSLLFCDLLDADKLKSKLLDDCLLNPNRPTLFVAECVLNYLPVEAADNLLSVLSTTFLLSTFIVYEQIEPCDKFGRTMVKHFESIHSPLLCIEKYPTVRSQLGRYRKLGFPAVECLPIGYLYDTYLTPAQREHVTSLEMFDEYEMWHAKCAHYVITIASTAGEIHERLLSHFNVPHFDPCSNEHLSTTSTLQTNLHPIDLSSGHFQRFGHKSVLLERIVDGRRSVYVFSCGGWGVGEKSKQCRLRNPCLLSLDTYSAVKCQMDVSVLNETGSNVGSKGTPNRLLERCYHSLTPVADSRTFFLFGGRRSPNEALASPLILRISPHLDLLELVPFVSETDQPEIRWRHAAVGISLQGTGIDAVVVSGGLKNADQHPLSDCWMCSIDDQRWTRLPDLPVGVHSHGMCCDSVHNGLIVLGGLGKDEVGPVQFYSFVTNRWTVLEAPPGFRTYGSVWFNYQSTVVRVGGASPQRGECRSVAMMQLSVVQMQPRVEFSSVYELPYMDFMLMGHDAALDETSDRVFVIGGGGNCFSFGTCFNKAVMELKLPTIRSSEL